MNRRPLLVQRVGIEQIRRARVLDELRVVWAVDSSNARPTDEISASSQVARPAIAFPRALAGRSRLARA